MTGNEQLAADLRAQADDIMHHRRVMLVCSVALAETATVAAARKVLAEWPGPARIRRDAIELLNHLTSPE